MVADAEPCVCSANAEPMRAFPDIRLIRPVNEPDGHGPGNGQYALQRLLRANGPSWLKIGGGLRPGEIPWVWCFLDAPVLAMHAAMNMPFVAGPNVLFAASRRPRARDYERDVCDAASCRLLFTESDWYGELIRANLGPANRAPLVLWPYPIYPQPDGPDPQPTLDLVIYAKSGIGNDVIAALRQKFRRSAAVRYGHYQRSRLLDAARRARCCAYLSDDDRGPLALAEILLSGCPAVGIPRGAPWIEPGVTGQLAASLSIDDLLPAIDAAMQLARQAVRAAALERFDDAAIVRTIVEALDAVRQTA